MHLLASSHAAVGVSLLFILSGCQVYDATLVDAGVDGGTVDAGSCTLRQRPSRPEAADGPDVEEALFGLRMVVLEQQDGDAWRDIGIDLDGRCTESPTFETECRPPRRTRPPSDGNEGIDNVFGAELFPLVELSVMGLEMSARMAQEQGALPVIRLRGWNGLDNDPRVDVTVTNAIYTVPAMGDGPTPHIVNDNFEPEADGMRLPFPAWDGTDYGYFREETFLEGDPELPIIRDDNAFVVDRHLVSRLPDRIEILFPAEDAGVLVRLTDASAIGRISDDGSTLENLMVTGRWRVLDLLATAENVGVCRDSDAYNILVGQLDTIADVRSRPGTGGEDIECDAISLGVVFTGTRMRWGGLTPGQPVRNVCDTPDAGPMGLDGGVGMDGG